MADKPQIPGIRTEALTHAEMQAHLATGGAIIHNGKVITAADQLPTMVEIALASGDQSQVEQTEEHLLRQFSDISGQLAKLEEAKAAKAAAAGVQVTDSGITGATGKGVVGNPQTLGGGQSDDGGLKLTPDNTGSTEQNPPLVNNTSHSRPRGGSNTSPKAPVVPAHDEVIVTPVENETTPSTPENPETPTNPGGVNPPQE